METQIPYALHCRLVGPAADPKTPTKRHAARRNCVAFRVEAQEKTGSPMQ